MSWKQSGGIKQFDANKNLNVNSISTDSFTMRESYKGTFQILGEFFVSQDCSLNANVNIGENVNIGKNAIIGENAIIGKNLSVKKIISIGDMSYNTNVITTSSNGLLGIGINVQNPIALLDLSGNSSKIMNVYSSLPNVNSTLLRNSFNDQTNITLDNNRTASLSFVMGGNTISILYDLSKDLISVNRDISFVRTVFIGGNTKIIENLNIGKNAVIGRSLTVSDDVSMGGNFSISGNLSVRGNISIAGDLSLNGNANMGRVVVMNGLIIEKETVQNGNVFLGSNFGLFFNGLNEKDAILRKYNINTDGTKNGLITSGHQLYLNSDVVIGGNLYIDGSTNLIGNINYFGGGGGGGSSLDVSGTLTDLSGTDQSRFYVNYNSIHELSDNDLKGAGFYIYNNYKFGVDNVSVDKELRNHGFVKISDVCCNKLSIRTVGDSNVVAMDLTKMKNINKSGLLVLKHVTDIETDANDNYDIVSSHTDTNYIDVSNSLTGVKSIYVENLLSCEKDIFVGNSLSVNGNFSAICGAVGDITVGNLFLQNNLILSSGVNFNGDIITENIHLSNLFLNQDMFLSDTSVIQGNVLFCNVKDVIVGNDITIHGNLYLEKHANIGNIYLGNLILNQDMYLSDTSLIRGNVLHCNVKDVIVGNDITINGNLYLEKHANIGNIYLGNLILEKDIYLSDTSVIRGNVLRCANDLLVEKDITINGNLYLAKQAKIGNVYLGNLILEKDIYLSQNSVIYGNLSGTMNVENLIAKNDITIQANLKVLQNVSIAGECIGNSMVLNFGPPDTDTTKANRFHGNCDVVAKILEIQNTVIGTAVTAASSNTFAASNTFQERTVFQSGSYFRDIYLETDISCNRDIGVGGNGLFNKHVTILGNTYLKNSTHITGNTYINGIVDISGNIIVSGLSTFNHSVIVTKDLSIQGKGNLYVANTSIFTDVSINNSLIVGNLLTLHGDFRTGNGNIYINKDAFIYGNLDVSGSTFTNHMIVRGLSTFNDSVIVTKNLSIQGEGTLHVANTSIFADISINNNLIIGNNLTLHGDFRTGNGNIYINKDAFIYGNLDVSGSTFTNQTFVRGNIEVYGNLFLTHGLTAEGFADFRGSVAVARDISLGGNLNVTKMAYVHDLTATENIYVGNMLTVNGNATIKGNVAMTGSSVSVTSDCMFNGNVAINHDLYIHGKNINFVGGGDILLNEGNLSFIYDASRSTMTPGILKRLINVKSDIQSQIDNITSGGNVNRLSKNTFTEDNSFNANVYVKSLNASTVNASVFTITQHLNVTGSPSNEGYVILEDGAHKDYQAYVTRNKAGRITTKDNIWCTGEDLIRFMFKGDSGLIADGGGVLEASAFFDTFGYSTEKGLYHKVQPSDKLTDIVPLTDYSMDTHTEGGAIHCLDLILSRIFTMQGAMYMSGNIHINGNIYTSATLENALKGASASESSDIIPTTSFTSIIASDFVRLNGGDLTLTSGNVSMTSGSLNLTSGNVSMTSGSLKLTSGNVSMTSGSLNLTSGSVTAVSFNASSDYRLKYDIQTISGSYYTVDNLRPVSYSFRHSHDPHIGFIAHELQEHFPTAVQGEKDGKRMQSVNYAEIIPILVKEIQDLKREVFRINSILQNK
jgi:predicted acyltransferase (DUF342 family)